MKTHEPALKAQLTPLLSVTAGRKRPAGQVLGACLRGDTVGEESAGALRMPDSDRRALCPWELSVSRRGGSGPPSSAPAETSLL